MPGPILNVLLKFFVCFSLIIIPCATYCHSCFTGGDMKLKIKQLLGSRASFYTHGSTHMLPCDSQAAWEYFTKSSILDYHQDWAILASLGVHWFKTTLPLHECGFNPWSEKFHMPWSVAKGQKKIGLFCICCNMEVCRDYYTKWSKPDRERQISHHLYVESQKKKKVNLFTRHKQTHRHRKQT